MTTFPVAPCPKPRMTRADRWKKRPIVLKYFDFADALRDAAPEGYEVPRVLSVTFVVPFPKSYSKKKRESLLGQPHEQRPDLDNYIKAFQDALAKEDCQIHTYKNCRKIWGETGKIIEGL